MLRFILLHTLSSHNLVHMLCWFAGNLSLYHLAVTPPPIYISLHDSLYGLMIADLQSAWNQWLSRNVTRDLLSCIYIYIYIYTYTYAYTYTYMHIYMYIYMCEKLLNNPFSLCHVRAGAYAPSNQHRLALVNRLTKIAGWSIPRICLAFSMRCKRCTLCKLIDARLPGLAKVSTWNVGNEIKMETPIYTSFKPAAVSLGLGM